MVAASPIPALADRVSELRDLIRERGAELDGIETPEARRELLTLRKAALPLGSAEGHLRMHLHDTPPEPGPPLVREALPGSLRDPRVHRGYHP